MREHRTSNNQQPTSNGGKTSARKSLLFDVGCWWLVVSLPFLCRAEPFGDISVNAERDLHGQHVSRLRRNAREFGKPFVQQTHRVTLVFPNNAFGNYGNTISRLSRSVTLEPGAREVVSLLQPPLPAQGDGSIRVEVDGRREGEVRAPNAKTTAIFIRAAGRRRRCSSAAAWILTRSSACSSEPRGVHGGDGRRGTGCHWQRIPAHGLDSRLTAIRGDELGWNWITRHRRQ